MIKRVNISVSEEEHKRMKQLALDMDMSVSQIIQRCFFKLAHDEKMRAIIKKGEFTSNNVRDDKQKRSDEADPDSSSLNPNSYIPASYEEWKHFQEVMKANWIDQQ